MLAEGGGGMVLGAKTTTDGRGNFWRAPLIGAKKQNGKSLPAVTSGNFRAPAMFLHHTRQAIQGAVPCQVTEAVVNAFQVVEIQEEQGKGLMRATSAAEFAFQAL